MFCRLFKFLSGSWHTRGHCSSLGLGVVIDAHTTLALDYEVMSKKCMACSRMATSLKAKKITQAKLDAWKHQHQAKCNLNYAGSSGGMEEKSAKLIWNRSLQKKLRYINFIGDGDCSSYNAITSMNDGAGPYGAQKEVEKEECVNHVHKRMGTAFRKLVKETTVETETQKGGVRQKKLLGGRGKLTESVIEKVQDYYGAAIRRHVNGTVEEMSRDIWSTYYHCSSTDNKHNHFYCPEGIKSRCFWQKALAKKKMEEEEKRQRQQEREQELGGPSTAAVSFYGKVKQKPEKPFQMPSHKNMLVKFGVEGPELKKIKDIYTRLTDPDLLKRCLKGKTQNPNESLHHRIWKYCPKVANLGKITLDFAVAQAVLIYNIGYDAGSLCSALGIPSESMTTMLQEKDISREMVIKSRPRRKRKKLEVDPHYGAGEH